MMLRTSVENVRYSYRNDPQVPPFPDDKPIIIFDGHCALCAGSVKFILRHDKAGRYRLLAAQTPLGQALYRHYGLDLVHCETTILMAQGRVWFNLNSSVDRSLASITD
jgi:predicted DCC family thiol-disulfide oxidoreductase YuxK